MHATRRRGPSGEAGPRRCATLRRAASWAAVLAGVFLGCRSVYDAELPRSASTARRIEHCLISLGLEDRSGEPESAAALAGDPRLVAVWASRYHRSRWHLGATAFVRRESDRWRIRFLPGPPGSSDAVEVFADGFSRCIAVHEPGLRVEVIGRRRLDLW